MKLQLKLLRKVNWQNYKKLLVKMVKEQLIIKFLRTKVTPHRKKEYRNSRVKKRKQYEKAQKKLKSVRQVYDANNRGPYEGEKTGIKKGLSRSVKLV